VNALPDRARTGFVHLGSDPLAAAMNPQLASTIAAIDDANRQDPNNLNGQPLAMVQGQAGSRWLDELCATPRDELRLAVRAHHLRRWELKRVDYPEGRSGYLRWRRANKAHQADSLASLMQEDEWPESSIELARLLLGRTKLRTDLDTQTLEDAACLVFLETQFEAMTERTEHKHLVSIVAKTLNKMSPGAVILAGSIGLSTTSRALLADAFASAGDEVLDDD
jgi:hypothetical protein